jgi:DNA helicase-2/ATP-dependent DNA helicase PcrA
MDTDNMTVEQLAVINDPNPQLAVVAAAGSGKTKVLVGRYFRSVLNRGVDPDQVAIITYTTDAAKEIERRILAVSREFKPGFLGTIHGFGLKLLRLHGSSIGLHGGLAVADEKTANVILVQCMADLSMKCSFSAARKIVSGDHEEKPKERELFKLYHATMAKNGLVDFDGILFRTDELVTKREGKTHFKMLMVDEYQDVADIHHRIIRNIATDEKFVVGDPRQAIFGFMGGNPGHLMSLHSSPYWKPMKLTLNFRSAPVIVATANRLSAFFKEPTDRMRTLSEDEGEVLHCHASNPAMQLSNLAEMISLHSGSRVVLCRYNRHLDEIHRGLEAMGIQCVAKSLRQKPPGWDIARSLVAFLSNPASPALAFTLVSLTQGTKRAEELEKESRETGVSMRRLIQMDRDRGFVELDDIMEEVKIPMETRWIIRNITASLPENEQTWTGLGAALADPEALGSKQEVSSGVVTLSTIHGFKGREADHVFLAYANDEFIPGNSTKQERIDEERRLFYVAITRAKKTLGILSTAQSVGFRGQDAIMATTQSRFISEAFNT